MSVYTGVEAVVTAVKKGSSDTPVLILKRKKIEWNGSKEFTTENYQGEPGAQNAAGAITYEGSITVHHDPDDLGQQLLKESFDDNEELTIVVMPVGAATGKRSVTFDAFVTDDPNNLELEANVEKTMGLKINGIPAEGVTT